jgi:hypothetical protein
MSISVEIFPIIFNRERQYFPIKLIVLLLFQLNRDEVFGKIEAFLCKILEAVFQSIAQNYGMCFVPQRIP